MRYPAIRHRGTESQRKTSPVSRISRASVLTSLFRRIRPLLIPVAQQKFAVALRVALVAQYREPVVESPQKLFAIAFLHLLRLAPRFRRGLPFINRRGNLDLNPLFESRVFPRPQQSFH